MKLFVADWLIIFSLLLMISNHSITQYLIATHTTPEQTQQQADNLVTLVEANPLGALVLQLNKGKYIYSYFFAPSMMLGFYYFIRKRHKKNQDVLTMFGIIIFTMFSLNFLNDVTYLLAYFFG